MLLYLNELNIKLPHKQLSYKIHPYEWGKISATETETAATQEIYHIDKRCICHEMHDLLSTNSLHYFKKITNHPPSNIIHFNVFHKLLTRTIPTVHIRPHIIIKITNKTVFHPHLIIIPKILYIYIYKSIL